MSYLRSLWLVVILVALSLYFPINRMVHDGVQLLLPIDGLIPLFPPAIVPYLSGDALFIGVPIWAAIRAKPREFEAYTISILLATAVSYVVYFVFPTFVTRPEITSTDAFSRALMILYRTDRAYNAAPSGHAIYTVLSFLYLARWTPNYRPIWMVAAVLILVSTLLTRQHYVLDIASGIALAILAYIAGHFAEKRWVLTFASIRK
jgi:membrane-associated phospholipid phosphatase